MKTEVKTIGVSYGIWNTVTKQFQFGICEPSKTKAENRLIDRIGHNAKKYHCDGRRISDNRF